MKVTTLPVAQHNGLDEQTVRGMPLSRSDDTIIENVFVPDERIARVVPASATGIDHFVLGIFAWGLLNFGNVYHGLAQRIRDLIVESVKLSGMTPIWFC